MLPVMILVAASTCASEARSTVTPPKPSISSDSATTSLPLDEGSGGHALQSSTTSAGADTVKTGTLDINKIGRLVTLAENFLFTEGPVWDKNRSVLLFSDIDANKIYQLNLPDNISVYRDASNAANGLAFDNEGRLLAAEHGSRSLTLTLPDGSIKTLAKDYQGKQLNSPNDLAVRSDGTIYFSDPVYGLGKRPAGVEFMGLYRLNFSGVLHLEERFDKSPNGLVLSPDQRTLYLALTAANQIVAFNVNTDGSLSNLRNIAALPQPDGMTIDSAGDIFVAGADGVYIFSPDGYLQTVIHTPRQPTNCEFGGSEGNLLFITARQAVYYVPMPVRGL
jgi:gluconolactonase